MPSIILIRGGGDLATGVALRLIRSGLRVAITELPQPLTVRRTVSFAEAVFSHEMTVEGVTARCVNDATDTLSILSTFGRGQVPVLVDPDCASARILHPSVIVDARMTKHPPQPIGYIPQLYIGLGPGFEAGGNCQAVVETRRGHTLGRVYFHGTPEPDTGSPEGDPSRVLRAPCAGKLIAHSSIGDHINAGQVIAAIEMEVEHPATDQVSPVLVRSALNGLLRGLLHSGLPVTIGMKIGDIDPRDDPRFCTLVSDKALSVAGGVLEVILSKPELRFQLWS
jgi:xanthine dehydrogenase accessory factor